MEILICFAIAIGCLALIYGGLHLTFKILCKHYDEVEVSFEDCVLTIKCYDVIN